MLLILILYLQSKDYKYKEEIIGVLLGCILATKQNIGIEELKQNLQNL